MPSGKIKYNPYAIFKESRTPPGLYARQKWLNEGKSEQYRADFTTTVTALKSPFSDYNDRFEGILDSLHRLFGLHLTVREMDPFINTTLRELIVECNGRLPKIKRALLTDQLRGLPFAATSLEFFIVPATLFLSSIFGKANDPPIKKLYDKLASDVMNSTAFRRDPAAMYNSLRALVVHPGNEFRSVTDSVVSWMFDRQTAKGDWGPMIPFYQAVNALAHLNGPEANGQFKKALVHVIDIQNTDGSWGSADKEWQTFLVVHALRNKGVL